MSAQSCPTLCDPMDCSPPGSSVHGSLQARILEWVAIPFSRESSWPRDQTRVSCITGRIFTTEQPGKPIQFGGNYEKRQFSWCFLTLPRWMTGLGGTCKVVLLPLPLRASNNLVICLWKWFKNEKQNKQTNKKTGRNSRWCGISLLSSPNRSTARLYTSISTSASVTFNGYRVCVCVRGSVISDSLWHHRLYVAHQDVCVFKCF